MQKLSAAEAASIRDSARRIIAQVERVIVGKRDLIELVTVALLARGHVLIEDIPGVGKTTLAKAMAKAIGGSFKRIQFTPDLLPGDVTGLTIYNQNRTNLFSTPDRCSPTWCWLTKLTAPHPKRRALCWSRWKRCRLRLMV
jgi:MoxR-like ATPase